jgi:hypothetical protein
LRRCDKIKPNAEKAVMLIPVPFLALLAPFAMSIADTVPAYNLEPTCRGGMDAGANPQVSPDARFAQCLRQEEAARGTLQAQWMQFPAGDRTSCGDTAKLGSPSYVQLLTCLELAREARKLPKQ